MPLGAGYNVMPLWQNNILLAHLQPCPSHLKISAAKKIIIIFSHPFVVNNPGEYYLRFRIQLSIRFYINLTLI